VTARRAIAFDDPIAPRPLSLSRRERPPSTAYRLGWVVGCAWVHGRPVLLWTLALVAWPVTLYLLPALWAYQRGHPHRRGILVWTLLLGWTGSGWLAAWLYVWWVR
jgi:hypothetical protein